MGRRLNEQFRSVDGYAVAVNKRQRRGRDGLAVHLDRIDGHELANLNAVRGTGNQAKNRRQISARAAANRSPAHCPRESLCLTNDSWRDGPCRNGHQGAPWAVLPQRPRKLEAVAKKGVLVPYGQSGQISQFHLTEFRRRTAIGHDLPIFWKSSRSICQFRNAHCLVGRKIESRTLHLEINADGVPIISGTTTKVVEIVQDVLAYHWDAEDIHRQYPNLSLAQVHAALTYYYDHQQEMEEEIDQRRLRVAAIKAKRGDNTIRDKLRQLGHLP